MTATAALPVRDPRSETCCGAAARLTVSEAFERGLRRTREPPRAIEGPACADAEGQFARFSLDISADRIRAVAFRASPCATLIAYCEAAAGMADALDLAAGRALTARDLVAGLPGVPNAKQHRAVLAAAALRAAIIAALPAT